MSKIEINEDGDPFRGLLFAILFDVVIVLVIVFLFGCSEDLDAYEQSVESAVFTDTVDPPDPDPIDFKAYVDEHCAQAEGRRFFVVDPDFTDAELEIILGAVDHANDVLDARVEICGKYDAALYGGGFIKLGDVNDGTPDTWTGSYNDDVLTLYTERARHDEHLRKVLLHELGHYFGASHSVDVGDIMTSGWNGVSSYSAADVETIGGLI